MTSPLKVLFRLDADATIGAGHLARCTSIAHALRAEGAVAEFVLGRASETASLPWLERHGIDAHWLADSDALDPRVMVACMSERKSTLIVVDGYQFDIAYLAALGRGGRATTAYIDDLAACAIPCDLVINPNLHADVHPSVTAGHGTALNGVSFALVRSEFLAARIHKPQPGPVVQNVLVTMGGADPIDMTTRILRGLERTHVRSLDVVVIVGGANRHARSVLAESERHTRHHVSVIRDVPNMADFFVRADLAVAAAGGTCVELACVGVPTIAVAIADNQRLGAEAGNRLGVFRSLGPASGVDEATIARSVDALTEDIELRQSMITAQRTRVDGRGASRVAKALLELSTREDRRRR